SAVEAASVSVSGTSICQGASSSAIMAPRPPLSTGFAAQATAAALANRNDADRPAIAPLDPPLVMRVPGETSERRGVGPISHVERVGVGGEHVERFLKLLPGPVSYGKQLL